MRRSGGGRLAREAPARGKPEAAAALILIVGICVLIAANLVPSHNHEGVIAGAADKAAPPKRAAALSPMPTLAATGDINVNTATLDELQQIHGVGPALAAQIVAEREQNGRFAYPEDLLAVKGIGRRTLEKLLEQITLE